MRSYERSTLSYIQDPSPVGFIRAIRTNPGKEVTELASITRPTKVSTVYLIILLQQSLIIGSQLIYGGCGGLRLDADSELPSQHVVVLCVALISSDEKLRNSLDITFTVYRNRRPARHSLGLGF